MAFVRVDHVGIVCHDIEPALHFYRDVLGLTARPAPHVGGEITAFTVGQSAIVLSAGRDGSRIARELDRPGEGVHWLAFETDDDEGAATLDPQDHFGLGVVIVDSTTAISQADQDPPTGNVQNIDHIVISSGDSATVAAHFRDRFGIEIKRTMSRPGTRSHLEFAKLYDVILEFAGPPEPRPAPIEAKYWGIVFTVTDIHHAVAQTRDAGIRCDDPRTAVQPGALIAGVKESTGGVPFAFIQYNAI